MPPVFSAKQAHALLTFHRRIVLLVGAVRSGKTFIAYFMLVKAILLLIQREKRLGRHLGDVVIIGKTERTVLRNIINPMFEIFGSQVMRYKSGKGELTLFGRLIYIIGANDDRSEEKIRGMTVALAMGDEITLWPEGFFTQLLARMSAEGAQLIGTTNPDSPFHWLKMKYLDKAWNNIHLPKDERLDLEAYHFTLDDNIALDEKYKSNLRKEFVGVWFRRFILGEWCIAEGLVYDMFDEEVHVFPNDRIGATPEIVEHWVSLDYGTGNPTVFGLFGADAQGHNYLLRTWRWDSAKERAQKTDYQYKEDLKRFLEAYNDEMEATYGANSYEYRHLRLQNIYNITIYADPSAASFLSELIVNSGGFKFTSVMRANNSVNDGIRYVSSLLSNRKFFIHKSCASSLQEFATYAWDEKAQKEHGEDKVVKKYDHDMDMIRYGLYTRFVPRGGPSKLLYGKKRK